MRSDHAKLSANLWAAYGAQDYPEPFANLEKNLDDSDDEEDE